MNAIPHANNGFFRGLIAIISSAALASGFVYALFSSFLTTLVPPIVDSHHSVQFGTFGTAIMVLALSLIVRQKLSTAKARKIGVAGLLCVLLAAGLFIFFKDYSRTFVYRYPPLSQPNPAQQLHIGGKLHTQGIQYVGNKTVSQAVYELGGPDHVDAQGTLWTSKSKLDVIENLEMLYLALSSALTFATFLLGFAAWRTR